MPRMRPSLPVLIGPLPGPLTGMCLVALSDIGIGLRSFYSETLRCDERHEMRRRDCRQTQRHGASGDTKRNLHDRSFAPFKGSCAYSRRATAN